MLRTSCLIGKLYQAIGTPGPNGINNESSPPMTPQLTKTSWPALCVVILALTAQGCAHLTIPKTPFARHSRQYQGVDSSYDNGQSAVSKAVYHSVRRAKAENSVVLQVLGDEENPARVLPLPPGTQSVYVSELLTQTGVLQELKFVDATLFRYSTGAIGGIPMVVKMNNERTAVLPESDYSLQAGDRLMVSRAANPVMQTLVNSLFGM